MKGIVFDFDGTLANSLISGLAPFHYAFQAMGLPVQEDDAVKKYFGSGADRIFYGILGDWPKALVAFEHYKNYRSQNAFHSSWHDGIEELLQNISKNQVKTAIVTGRHSEDLDLVTQRLEIRSHFTTVICDNHLKESKPSPEGILLAAKALDLHPSDLIYVGDSASDIVAAKAAGACSVAALWDSSARRENFHLTPDFWVHSPEELWKVYLDLVSANKLPPERADL